MRTTITFERDVAAALTRARRERSAGVSEVVNDLIRAGLERRDEAPPLVRRTHALGLRIDVTDVAEALETLDGPTAH